MLPILWAMYWHWVITVWFAPYLAPATSPESKEKKITPIATPRKTTLVGLGLKESKEEIKLIWNSNLTANVDTLFGWSLEVMKSVKVSDPKEIIKAQEEIFHEIENFCLQWVDEKWCKPTSYMAYA